MALLELSGAPVMSGVLTRALRGSWTADLEVDADDAPTGSVTLAGAGLSLVGTVIQSQNWNDRQRARVVAGAGGMRRELAPAWYRNATLRTLVAEVLAAAGERLSATSDAALLARPVPAWLRVRGTAATILDQLLAVWTTGAIWRHLDDGTVWIGVPSWPTVTTAAVVQDNRGDEEIADLAGEDLTLDAGQVVLGRRVGLVRHLVQPSALRTEAWWYRDERGLAASVAAMVERLVGHRLDMRAAYPCRVVSQASDGSLDLVPDSKRIAPMTGVPIVYSEPGTVAKVKAGARCYVEFAEGDPSKPVVRGFASGAVSELTIDADKVRLGGDREVARKGDSVAVFITASTAADITKLSASGGLGSVPVAGYVLNGSSKVKSG